MKMEQFQDVELVSDGEIISCHKLILALHSEYFRTFFSMNMSSFEEVDRNRVEIMCIGPDTMKTVKKFLYTGEIEEVTRDDGIVRHRERGQVKDRKTLGYVLKSRSEVIVQRLR